MQDIRRIFLEADEETTIIIYQILSEKGDSRKVIIGNNPAEGRRRWKNVVRNRYVKPFARPWTAEELALLRVCWSNACELANKLSNDVSALFLRCPFHRTAASWLGP